MAEIEAEKKNNPGTVRWLVATREREHQVRGDRLQEVDDLFYIWRDGSLIAVFDKSCVLCIAPI